MTKRLMEKTTFSEICRMMKSGNDQYKECIKSVFNIALLFFPGLICKEAEALALLSAGTDLVAAKSIIEKGKDQIKGLFGNDDQPADFYSSYEKAQAAQVMMVFTAYFDSMALYLPDEYREIALSGKEKMVITEQSIADYNEWLKEHSPEAASPEAREILDYPLDLQMPLESVSDYKNRLCVFYKMLTDQLLAFFEKLSFLDDFSGSRKDKFFNTLNKLPAMAVENYRKQYFQLKKESEDFRIWADTWEHKNIEKQIDVGFKEVAKFFEELLAKYKEQSKGDGAKTLEKYRLHYEGLISEKILETEKEEFKADDGTNLVFPQKMNIFIPQAFKALEYKKDMQLEAEKTWGGKDLNGIGEFISASLHHSVTGNLPLLILGVPGAGKTLLCQMLAAQIFAPEYHVIIINLRDTAAEQSVIQQINDQIERDFANKCTWDEISDSAMSKPILLIFDGYDELLQASGRTYADYITKIARFQKEQRNHFGIQVKCIVTSRTTLIDKAYIPDGTTVMKLSDFKEDRINRWSDIWNSENSKYFKKHQIEKFAVRPDSKLFDLAKQPLLLFMLALYDSTENALKKNENLSYPQLYDQLIRDFIRREQQKQPGFSSGSREAQNNAINKEMRKVGIAAMGMYNRRILYIRGEDLEKDLAYLEHPAAGSRRPEEQYETLKDSEKLLGRFFFIHHAVSKEGNGKNASKRNAYEFLHNTFGEFLTADFVVSELVQKLRYLAVMENQCIEGISMERAPGAEKGYFSSLLYAPLFSRPMVVKMIREWAPVRFMSSGLDRNMIRDAMGILLKSEIGNVVNGEKILSLKEFLTENMNPFLKRDYYLHLAYYSLNLLSLSALICGNENAFSVDSKTWDKLIRLWRLAVSEEELLDFANLFQTEKENGLCNLRYVADSMLPSDAQERILRIRKIAQSLGDSELTALISTILGSGQPDKVLQMIEQNDLGISARYMRHRCQYSREERNYVVGLKNLIDEMNLFLDHCLETSDYQDILGYYRAVNELLRCIIRSKDTRPSSLFYKALLARAREALDRLKRWPRYDTSRQRFHVQIQNTIYDLISLIPFEIDGWKELLNTCIECEHYQIYLKTVNRLTKEFKTRESKTLKNLYNETGFLTAACGCLNEIKEDDYYSTQVPFVAEQIITVLKAGQVRVSDRSLTMIMPGMLRILEKMGMTWTVQQQAFAIDCLIISSKIKHDVSGWDSYLTLIVYRTSIKTVVGDSLRNAYSYLSILKKELQDIYKTSEGRADAMDWENNYHENSNKSNYYKSNGWTDNLRDELEWLLNHKKNDLTIKLYKIIQEILAEF